jgi:hypothetical protein
VSKNFYTSAVFSIPQKPSNRLTFLHACLRSASPYAEHSFLINQWRLFMVACLCLMGKKTAAVMLFEKLLLPAKTSYYITL